MIAKVCRGTGFGGLQSYLLRGSSGRDSDRVLWTATRNLASDDPERAAPVMRATAGLSERTEKPVWHLALAAEPGAQLDREDWERVADRVLRDLKLEEHQVLIVAHRDTKHPHIHLMVNRVHPETHRAWSTSHDYDGGESGRPGPAAGSGDGGAGVWCERSAFRGGTESARCGEACRGRGSGGSGDRRGRGVRAGAVSDGAGCRGRHVRPSG